MSEEKRSRCTNFTASEMELLLSLVEEHKNVVECKKTDTVSNRDKEKEWELICQKFNCSAGTGRLPKQLRSKWDSWKKSTKKEYSTQRNSLYKTGGGPGGDVKLSSWGERVLGIIGASATGTVNKFDSDSVTNKGTAVGSTLSVEFEDPETENEWRQLNPPEPTVEATACGTSIITEAEVHWQQWSPALLKKPVHSALKPHTVAVTSEECSIDVYSPTNKIERKRYNSSHISSATREILAKPVQSALRPYAVAVTSEECSMEVRTPIHKNKRKRLNSSQTQSVTPETLAKKKLELLQLQINLMKKEHRLKEKRNAAKHKMEMTLMRVQIRKLKEKEGCKAQSREDGDEGSNKGT